MKTRLPASPGFSLVEVALSLAILSVAMVGVLSLLPVGLDAARQVHAEAVAVQVIRGAIGEIEASNRAATNFLSFSSRLYNADGQGTGTSGYFALDVQRTNVTPDSCRYFLTLRWPAAASNRPTAQIRFFVSDQVRSW